MRTLLSEFFSFVYSTLNQWQALVSGGVVTALVAVFERVSGYHLTKRAYLALFVGTFLFVAFFLGWREERRGRLEQLAKIQEMHLTKPRLVGEIMYYRFADRPDYPDKTALFVIASISNVGSTASIVDYWSCTLRLHTRDGEKVILGEPRAVPDNLTLGRGPNQPMVFGREDGLYVKGMKTPIGPGAKVVGVLVYHFPKMTRDQILSSSENSFSVGFKNVLGEPHEFGLKYLQLQNAVSDKGAEWIDLPGLERPTHVPPPVKESETP